MLREETLRSFLEDDLFIEKGYLKEGDAQKYKWATPSSKLIEVIKLAIEGESLKENVGITERKINSFLNQQS